MWTRGGAGKRSVAIWLWALIPPLLAAAGYGALCLWFVAHQGEFQFGDVHSPRVSPQSVGLTGFAAVEIRTEDGEVLDAWWAPPPAPGRGVVLFLHGTPSTLADTVWRLPDLQKSGFGATAIDYRGYGASTGVPSEAGLRVFVSEIEALPRLKSLIGREAGGRGRVTVVLDLPRNEVEVALPGGFRVDPRIRAAVKSLPGILDVHDI